MPHAPIQEFASRADLARERCAAKVNALVYQHANTHSPSPGIDVQAELRAKTGSPNLGPVRAPASATTSPNQAPLQQRAILNRQQQRRSIGGPTKAEGPHALPMIQPDGALPNRSPLSQPTPSSHLSSPSTSATRSPNFIPQGTSVSPNFGPMSHQQPQLRPQPPRSNFTPMMGPQRPSLITNQPPSNGLSSASTASGGSAMTQSSATGSHSSYYTPPFTDHMNQLGKLTRFLFPVLRHRALFVLD